MLARCNSAREEERPHRHDEQDPSFRVSGGLQNLVFLEVVILDTLTICRNSLNGYHLLFRGKKACSRRQVGHKDQEYHSPCNAYGTEDQEDVHPLLEARRNMTLKESACTFSHVVYGTYDSKAQDAANIPAMPFIQ